MFFEISGYTKEAMVFRRRILIALSVFVVGFLSASPVFGTDDVVRDQIASNLSSYQPLSTITADAPTIEKPDWYYLYTISYSVTTAGTVQGDVDQFAQYANQTLNDDRGWKQLGARFVEVESGGDFTLVLSQAEYLPTFSSFCSADWSCRVGNYVIINDDRWLYATTAWNDNGGSLREYQHMVVNHEVGHWLGHGHANCSGAGNLAAVMQQQSIDLQGCTFNPWPLASELWTTRF